LGSPPPERIAAGGARSSKKFLYQVFYNFNTQVVE